MNYALTILLLVVVWSPAVAQGPIPPVTPPGFVLVDDMILPEAVVFGESSFTANPWPYGVVPYAFNANVSAANQTEALEAMAEISAVSGVIFVPHTVTADWIVFNATTVNSSVVGMQGGAQTINITSWGTKYIIVHEILHALGYLHEQSRPDRDSFVTINYGNIQTTGCPGSNCPGSGGSSCVCNFNTVNSATTATTYDFLSIMHYGRTAFSSNSLDTITCQPAFAGFQTQIGNRTFMSLLDAQGLQTRYGGPLVTPSITSISPSSVTTATGTFTLDVYGSSFFEGSPNANGVQGTKIRWNGTTLATSYVDSGHLTAQIPGSLLTQPQTVEITVINPAPGTGNGLGSQTLMISCPPAGAVALANGWPQTITSGCTGWSINPAANAWSVVGVSSATANWDISAANTSSFFGGTSTDYVGNSGVWSGVNPASGGFQLASGSGVATAEFVASVPLSVGVPKISEISQGHILKAFHFTPFSPSTYLISTSGRPNLFWTLLWQGNNSSVQWQSPMIPVASGQVGGPVATNLWLANGSYCLVVSRAQIGIFGGPAPDTEPFTINVCFNGSISSIPYAIPMVNLSGASTNQGFCHPFTFSPLAGRWNAVGVSSTGDWDIAIGSAESQIGGLFFGGVCDYVIANGRQGTIAPTQGTVSRYSGNADGNVQHAFVGGPGSIGSVNTLYCYMLAVVEFQVPAAGDYTISVNSTIPGGGPYSWDLHGPGTSSVWRNRISAMTWGRGADGSPVGLTLGPGWHALVVARDGGADWNNGYPGGVNAMVSITQITNPAPALGSTSPASMLAGSAAFQLDVFGSGFSPASVVRWNGAALPTGFVSPTHLYASVADTLVVNMGSAAVTVATPAPGGGTSGAITFAITGNPVPGAITVTPHYAPVGSPSVSVLVDGTNFVPGAETRWDGSPLPTTFVSSTQLSVSLTSSLLQAPGYRQISVVNPAPGGGASSPYAFNVVNPIIATVSPGSIPVMAAASAPVTVDVSGYYFLPSSVIVADGTVLPTTWINAGNVRCQVGPSLPQTLRAGGICINVQNTVQGFSNSGALVVGSGSNQGTLYRQPLMPAPGQVHAVTLEYGRPFAVYSVFADIGNPPPLTAWPSASANMVLSVGPIVTPAGQLIPLMDGLGIVSPATGATLNSGGHITIPGFVMPNPPYGIDLTVQGVYIDPTSPVGFRLTWARDHAGI